MTNGNMFGVSYIDHSRRQPEHREPVRLRRRTSPGCRQIGSKTL